MRIISAAYSKKQRMISHNQSVVKRETKFCIMEPFVEFTAESEKNSSNCGNEVEVVVEMSSKESILSHSKCDCLSKKLA